MPVDLLRSVGLECRCAYHHAVDVMHFGKRCCPIEFPVGPSVIGDGLMVLLMPHHSHIAIRKCVLCHGGDHGGFGDGYRRVERKHLAPFMFPHVDVQR